MFRLLDPAGSAFGCDRARNAFVIIVSDWGRDVC